MVDSKRLNELREDLFWKSMRVVELLEAEMEDTDLYREAVKQRDEAREELRKALEGE